LSLQSGNSRSPKSSNAYPTSMPNVPRSPCYGDPLLRATEPSNDASVERRPAIHTETARGLTVLEVARRYRVSPDRVRGWIARGELRAINRRDTRAGRPSWVIPPDALIEFESVRQAAATKPPKAKGRKRTTLIDFFPD
jgi:hypothetical protein